MCGLTGFLLSRSVECKLAEQRLAAMAATLRHRGPDDQGVWSDGRAGLGFARLSILDLSRAGHQPMGGLDGRVWLAFNGEIYNFQDLRAELQAKGHVFRSRSDTEVILQGYLAWGEDVLRHLRGMFAIALWDGRSRQLLLARDRIGKKPLNYALTNDGLFFGSEIKAILAWPGMPRDADLGALHQFLTYQYVPAPLTAFRAVKKLPAAHKLVIGIDDAGRLSAPRIDRYWRLPAPRPRHRSINLADAAAELTSRLEESVRIRMISDVPLGAFLSGGVDSSAIVAMMAKQGGGRVKTFSIGFENAEYDETRYARMVAERYGTDHHELVVRPDAVGILPKLVYHYNEPFADPSAVPTYYLAELARRHVTVALNGDGGDEAFMGYNRYASMQAVSRLDRLPKWLRHLGAQGIGALPLHGRTASRAAKIAGLLQADAQAPQHRYAFTITAFADEHKRAGYGEAMRGYLQTSALDILQPYFEEADSLVSGANWSDIHLYLPDDLMAKVDIATMAHSLESRSPLLDHVFLEWALTLPEDVTISRGVSKAIFKKAMEPYLPPEILYRPKMGFGCPVDHWFRDELKEMAYDLLLSPQATSRGIIERDAVKTLLDEHCSGAVRHDTRLWPLLMMELWFRMWVDADGRIAQETVVEDLPSFTERAGGNETPKSILLRLHPNSMNFDRGHAYIAQLPPAVPRYDTSETPLRSKARLFENAAELGPRHIEHDQIRAMGGGRFSHWGSQLCFSASDNSSPIENGRDYHLLIPASAFAPDDISLALGFDNAEFSTMTPSQRFAFVRALYRKLWRDTPLPDHDRRIDHDVSFAREFARLSPESDVTHERKYNLDQLFKLVLQVDGDVAECGTYKGGSAFFLARHIVKGRLDKRLCLFDSFEGLSAPASIDGYYWHAGALASTIEDVRSVLAPLGPVPFVEFYKGWIPDRFSEVADRRFCFVHIDVDLFEPTLSSIAFFYPRMEPGGIILLDDYGFDTCPGVTAAVDQFMAGRPEPVINLASGGAFIMVKADNSI